MFLTNDINKRFVIKDLLKIFIKLYLKNNNIFQMEDKKIKQIISNFNNKKDPNVIDYFQKSKNIATIIYNSDKKMSQKLYKQYKYHLADIDIK